MFKTLQISLRITALIVGVGVLLFAVAILAKRSLLPSRIDTLSQQKLDDLAAPIQILVELNQSAVLQRALERWVELDRSIASVGLRAPDGSLVISSSSHASSWSEENSAYLKCARPLRLGDATRGTIEFCMVISALQRAEIEPYQEIRLLAIFIIIGMLTYPWLVRYVSRYFENSGLIPDRVRQALDTLAEGLVVLDEQEKIVLANRTFAITCGIPQDQLLGKTASSLAWIADDATSRGDFPWIRALADNCPHLDQRLQYQLDDGGHRVFSVNSSPIVNRDGKRHGALATFRDVTEVEEHRAQLENMLVMLKSSRDEVSRKNRELEILATQDSLTGCLNRRAFFDRFSRIWEQSAKSRTPLACVMVDNDHFKSVNDTYGHHVGDEVLRAVSATIRQHPFDGKLVCRYGGEEFCILLPGKNQQEAAAIAEEIRLAIAAIRLEDPSQLRLTASVGVSEIGQGAKDPQDLINQADKCLYVAKRSGRNRVVVYLPEMAEMEIDDSKVSRTKEPAKENPTLPFPAVTALLAALSYRDPRTAEHSRRVAELSVSIGEGVLDSQTLHLLEVAALMHDIGKIGVSDQILLKPGPLTEEEWEVMRRHQRLGLELLRSTFNSPDLESILQLAKTPFNQPADAEMQATAESLRVAARILAIADSYDSITSDSVYRKRKSSREALLELRQCAGTQFDPTLVVRLMECISTREACGLPSTTTTATMPAQTAMQLGQQLERLVEALGHRDIAGLTALAGRLRATAMQANLTEVVHAAAKLEQHASNPQEPMMHLVAITTELLQVCQQAHARTQSTSPARK